MMVMTRSPARMIRKAISSLISTNRFFGVLSLRLRVSSGNVDTITGDGVNLVYNPEWVTTAPHDQIKGAIAHIVYACALKHHLRRGERTEQRWNTASRMVTAELLRRENVWVPDHIPSEDLPIEVVYNMLPEELPKGKKDNGRNDDGNNPDDAVLPPLGIEAALGLGDENDESQEGQKSNDGQNGQQDGQDRQDEQDGQDGQDEQSDPPPPGEIKDAPEGEEESQDKMWDRASKQAIQIAKSTGDASGNIEQQFENQHKHRRDWRDILLEYMRSSAPMDYSWAHPNRRYIDQGIYLPTLDGQGMGPIVIAIDTSGSVNDDQVNQAFTEMLTVMDEVKPSLIHVIQCDHDIKDVMSFNPDDPPIEITIKGRGGTRFQPVFDYVKEHQLEPEIMIYMTDLEIWEEDWPDEPDYPVIWAVENEEQAEKAHYGQTVIIDTEEQ